MFYSVALAILSFMALNRVFAVCLPLRPYLVGKRMLCFHILLSYGICGGFALGFGLQSLEGAGIIYSKNLRACLQKTSSDKNHLLRRIVIAILPTTLPLLPSIICYGLIFIKVRRSYANLQRFDSLESTNSSTSSIPSLLSKRHLQQEIYIAKSACLTFVVFALFVTMPTLVYTILGTSGSISNNTYWILGKMFYYPSHM